MNPSPGRKRQLMERIREENKQLCKHQPTHTVTSKLGSCVSSKIMYPPAEQKQNSIDQSSESIFHRQYGLCTCRDIIDEAVNRKVEVGEQQ